MIIVTCAAGYETYSFDELKKMDPTVTNRVGLDTGTYRVKTEMTFSEFSKKAQTTDLIFTRHIQPVDSILLISRTKDDLLQFIEIFRSYSNELRPNQKIAVQVRRVSGMDYDYTTYGVKESIDPFIIEKSALSVIQDPELIVSIFLSKEEAYFGISQAIENLSDWSGGAIRFRRTDNQVSRSRFKLEEAFLVFNIPIETYQQALDLGAAPGGWTSFLLDMGLQVTAVDTGSLESQFLDHENLHFINKNADHVQFPSDSFDILTCDMSWDPFHTANIVKNLAASVEHDGIAIVTIKLMHKKILKTIDEFIKILEPEFSKIKVKQLFHNRDEVTAYLRKN